MGGASQRPKGVKKTFWVKTTLQMNSAPSNYSKCKFSAKSNKVNYNDPKNQWAGSADAQKGVMTTFFGQKNIKKEFSALKLVRVQIFSQLSKNHY